MKNVNEFKIGYDPSSADVLWACEAAYTLANNLNKKFGSNICVTTEQDGERCVVFERLDIENKNLCRVFSRGNNIILAAACASGYDKVSEYFMTLFDGEGNLTAELPMDVELDAADVSIAGEHGDLRVIYHNIFGYDRNPTINSEKRFAFQVALYREYGAPLLCLQEYDVIPRELMDPILKEAGYTEVDVDFSALGKNCSPIFYDPTRLELLDQGYHPFFYVSPINPKVCNNGNTKNFTWAAFEDKKTGKRFVAISLHFYYAADAVVDTNERAESNLARIKNAEELLDVINNTIRPKYPTLPIVFGGDMNACYNHSSLESVKNSVTKGKTVIDMLNELEGCRAAQLTAPVFADTHTTCHAYPTYNSELGFYDYCADLTGLGFVRAIDHVYTYGAGMTAMTFDILHNTVSLKSSDHCPIVVDLKFE